MIWGSTFRGNHATEWGNVHEDVAALLYERYMTTKFYAKENDPNLLGFGQSKRIFEVTFPNLIVPREFPWAGVSPDGFVNDNGLLGGLEIKCPFRQTLYPVIPRTYNDQIQGSMGFLGLSFWDFVVWTPNELQIRRFEFNKAYWEQELFPKLESFYMEQFLPALVHKRNNRLEHGSTIPFLQ